MTAPRHEIPTHLNVEDKAFFGLAVRQVMVLTVGLAAAYGLWTGWPALPALLRGGLAAGGLLLAALLALVRPHGRGLEDWLFVALHYARTPKASVWRPREPARAQGDERQRLGGGRAAAELEGAEPMSYPPSVQSTHLRLQAIEDDVVCLAGGAYRAVLEIGSVNFGLQDERQQEATVAGYAACLNSLTFPVQVLVRILPIDLEHYLGELECRAAHRLPEHLADLARDHAAFLRRLARNRTLLERRYYLVVPAGREAVTLSRGWPFGRRAAALDPAAARRQLTVRCEELARQLARCELSARRLRSVELAQLYHACWCPELARTQRVRRALAEYTALVVQADDATKRRA